MLRLLRLSSKQFSKNSQGKHGAVTDVVISPQPGLQYKRIGLRPIDTLEQDAWKRIHKHFRDKEIAHLNGTRPSRMPLWLLKRILKTDAKRLDRETFGIYTNSSKLDSDNPKIAAQFDTIQELQNATQPTELGNTQDSYYYHQFPEYIGTIELYDMNREHATLGIIIGEKDYWSKGYGPEAIYALLCHSFDNLGLKRVKLNTYGDNIRAQRSFKRIGFVETKRIKNYRGREDVYMEIRKDAWQEFLRNPPQWHINHNN